MTREQKFWEHLFGLKKGDLMRHEDYPRVIWVVESTERHWINLRRVTKSDKILPYLISVLRSRWNSETKCQIRKISKV